MDLLDHGGRHHPREGCELCSSWPDWWRDLAIRLTIMGEIMTSNQEHLDTDIKGLTDGFKSLEDVITGLKAQPGADALDFSAADQLLASVQAAVAADSPAPAAPVVVLPLYEFAGDDQLSIDSTQWSLADVAATDGHALYHFAGDVDANATGASAEWVVYTGSTTPVTH
ncbi:hypothetical protein ACSMXN_09310 [Jatrophihabitans sp. DSM 45814]